MYCLARLEIDGWMDCCLWFGEWWFDGLEMNSWVDRCLLWDVHGVAAAFRPLSSPPGVHCSALLVPTL